MNKLTTIYNVMKNMKDFEKIAGDIEARVEKEDETVLEVNKTFSRNKEGEILKNFASIKVVYGDESFEHQFNSTFSVDRINHFCKGHGYFGGRFGKRRMMGGIMDNEGEVGHFTMKNRFQRFMVMLDLLNKAEVEKLKDDSKKIVISLDKDSLTDELKDLIKHKCMHKHPMIHKHVKGNYSGMKHDEMKKDHPMGLLSKDMDLKGLKAEILINNKDYIENVEINLELSDNEDKVVKFAFKGNVKEIA